MRSKHEAPAAAALGFSVFLSGAVLLGVEIVASRVLAPAFGSSLYVWGSLIGVVLTGLSIGYWVGGIIADRHPSPYLLIGALVLGAGLVLSVPLLDDWVIDRVVDWDPGPRLTPLAAAIALFAPLSIVLASASPIAVRLAARSLERLGHTAGRLFSISTAGSIAGTFATAFWLVPELGTDQVLVVGAVALLVAATVLALSQRLLPVAAMLALFAAATGALTTTIAPEQTGRLSASDVRNYSPVTREREKRSPGALDRRLAQEPGYDVREARDTRYHRMFVLDGSGTRYLRFDNTFQSGMELADPYATVFDYADYMQLGLAYAPSTRTVLFVGLGGGSVPKRMWRDFPQLQMHAAEIDPEVVRVARQWFKLPDDPRLRVTTEDGRRFLQSHRERWDMIQVDAYFSDSIPFHLSTTQFFELMRERLMPGGVIVSNVIGSVTGPGSKLLRSMVKTYRSVFTNVALHPVGGTGEETNVIVVATDGALPPEDALRENWRRLRAASPKAVDLDDAIAARWDRLIPFDDVPLLTDGYAPTDALLTG